MCVWQSGYSFSDLIVSFFLRLFVHVPFISHMKVIKASPRLSSYSAKKLGSWNWRYDQTTAWYLHFVSSKCYPTLFYSITDDPSAPSSLAVLLCWLLRISSLRWFATCRHWWIFSLPGSRNYSLYLCEHRHPEAWQYPIFTRHSHGN